MKDLSQYVSLVVAVILIITTNLGWLVKLRWSKEFAAAKNADIQAKESKIQLLERALQEARRMNPVALKEHHFSAVEMYEQAVSDLQTGLSLAENKLGEKEAELAEERAKGNANQDSIALLEAQIEDLRQEIGVAKTEGNLLGRLRGIPGKSVYATIVEDVLADHDIENGSEVLCGLLWLVGDTYVSAKATGGFGFSDGLDNLTGHHAIHLADSLRNFAWATGGIHRHNAENHARKAHELDSRRPKQLNRLTEEYWEVGGILFDCLTAVLDRAIAHWDTMAIETEKHMARVIAREGGSCT